MPNAIIVLTNPHAQPNDAIKVTIIIAHISAFIKLCVFRCCSLRSISSRTRLTTKGLLVAFKAALSSSFSLSRVSLLDILYRLKSEIKCYFGHSISPLLRLIKITVLLDILDKLLYLFNRFHWLKIHSLTIVVKAYLECERNGIYYIDTALTDGNIEVAVFKVEHITTFKK